MDGDNITWGANRTAASSEAELCAGDTFTFIITDKYGDGICCTWINETCTCNATAVAYELSLDGEVARDGEAQSLSPMPSL